MKVKVTIEVEGGAQLTHAQRAAILEHEAGHARELAKTEAADAWNLAADAEINRMLRPTDFSPTLRRLALTDDQRYERAQALEAICKEKGWEHTTSCYVEQVGNGTHEEFWVCRPGCPTLRARAVLKKTAK